jgi:hypothetical protein
MMKMQGYSVKFEGIFAYNKAKKDPEIKTQTERGMENDAYVLGGIFQDNKTAIHISAGTCTGDREAAASGKGV